jgi:hypothetical protein
VKETSSSITAHLCMTHTVGFVLNIHQGVLDLLGVKISNRPP